MDDSGHKERRKGVRRRGNETRLLDDRRAGPGRRIWARRASDEEVSEERREAERRSDVSRRSGKLRRKGERRGSDRRHD